MQSKPEPAGDSLKCASTLDKRRSRAWLLPSIIIVAAMAVSAYLRIVPLMGSVFSGQSVRFTGIDAYYYMRIVDNLVRNFPVLLNFDPYLIYPDGDYISRTPSFFAYILAGTIRLLAGAAPGQQAVDSIAVFIPPLIGMLLVIPAYFTLRVMAGRCAGMAGALLVAIMPGELLSRTMLGYTDHHGAEVLLSAFFSMFFILAVKKSRHFTYNALLNGEFPPLRHHVPYALLAGIFFGLYLVTWQGALLYLLIIFVYLVLQFTSDHVRGFPTEYLSKTTIICFLIALLMMLPFSRDRLTLVGLAVVMLTPLLLNMLSRLMLVANLRLIYYPVAAAGVCVITALIVWLAVPAVFNQALLNLRYIFCWRMEQNVVGEMRPLLFPGGDFTLDMAWSQFGLVFYSGLAGLVLLCYTVMRHGKPEHVFFAVMAFILIFASLSMVRFATYSGFVLALLTGYLAGEVVREIIRSGADKMHVSPALNPVRLRTKIQKTYAKQVMLIAMVALVITAVAAAAVINSINIVTRPSHMPTNSWVSGLNWMRENTPEPFGKADHYYQLYSLPRDDGQAKYPQSMYSVAGWIDYGYWIVRIAHRVPVSNPALRRTEICHYYLSQNQSTADPILQQLKSRYIIMDNRVAHFNDRFYAVCALTDRPESEFYELCWQKKGSNYQPLMVFYPEFYRSMLIRLYAYDGNRVDPHGTLVMHYAEKQLAGGRTLKEVLDLRNFASYAEAQNFVSSQPKGDYSVVGIDPLLSPVPLEELKGYKLVWSSSQQAGIGGSTTVPDVKVFEFKAAINE